MLFSSTCRTPSLIQRMAGLTGALSCWRRLGGVLLAAASLSACVAPTVSMQEGPREYVATDYDAVLNRWTRSESLILVDELETALTVTATLESWDFRWAYVIRYARDYRLTIPQRQRLLGEQLNETRDTHQFFVALYGSNYRQGNLTKRDSAWIVRLIDARGNETAPMQIEAVRESSVLERRYFPYNTVWRQAFRIRFPMVGQDGRPTLADDAEWIGLRFAGAYGNTDLIWDLKQPTDEDETVGGRTAVGKAAPPSP